MYTNIYYSTSVHFYSIQRMQYNHWGLQIQTMGNNTLKVSAHGRTTFHLSSNSFSHMQRQNGLEMALAIVLSFANYLSDLEHFTNMQIRSMGGRIPLDCFL